jgi:hypothetical protein
MSFHPIIPLVSVRAPFLYDFQCKTSLSMDVCFVGVAYQGKKDIVFKFIIEYSSLRDFGP